jgi:predicted TIM-barrel fold metal-dependent hydrolase
MDADGVDCSVLYPTVAGFAGETFARLADPELELACVRTYNDWLVEEWAGVSPRFIPQCIVPISPIEATVAEIHRAVEMGHRGVVFPAFPMLLREVAHVNDPEYDPVWSACQELGVPLCLHVGSSPRVRLPPHPEMPPALRAALEAMTRPVSGVSDVVNLLFSRILLRFPRLQVIFAESALGWGVFLLEYADHQFDQDHCEGYELKPSQMFRRQCFLTGWYDPVQPAVQHLGAGNLLWCANFPLSTSPWPMSQETIQRCFAGVEEADRHQILRGNAARLYGLPEEWPAAGHLS